VSDNKHRPNARRRDTAEATDDRAAPPPVAVAGS